MEPKHDAASVKVPPSQPDRELTEDELRAAAGGSGLFGTLSNVEANRKSTSLRTARNIRD